MFQRFNTWLKSIETSLDRSLGYDISDEKSRRRAYWHLQLIDHGCLRKYWTNLHEIAPGVWRSNQPDGRRIRTYKDMGIKTVLNLRGTALRSPYLFEREACEEAGITLLTHTLSARSLVGRKEMLALLKTFETIEKPFVMHCKSGADRAGLASAMYLLHIEKTSIAEARKQLSFKYLHIKKSKTGVLDYLLDGYEEQTKSKPMTLRYWIKKHYRKSKLLAAYAASK